MIFSKRAPTVCVIDNDRCKVTRYKPNHNVPGSIAYETYSVTIEEWMETPRMARYVDKESLENFRQKGA